MSGEPNDEAIRALHATNAKRQRNSRRMLLSGALFAVVLLALSPLFVRFYWQAKGRAALQREFEAIAGEPLTTSELAAYYAIPAGTADATHVWQQALAPFADSAYVFAAESVPVVDGRRIPKLSEPLDATHQELMERFLSEHAAKLEALHAAAETPGQVRFPRDFRTERTLHEQRLVRVARRLLALEFQLHVRQGNIAAALKNVDTRVRLGETLAYELDLSSCLIRGAIHGHTVYDIREWANAISLDEMTLVQLQNIAAKTSIHQQLAEALLGERAQSYLAACQPTPPVATLETTRDFRQVAHPADCARMLHNHSRLIQAARLLLPASRRAINAIGHELKALEEQSDVNQRHTLVDEEFSSDATIGLSDADARIEAQRQLTIAALAAHRFRKATGAWPRQCTDLAPQFAPEIPTDPHDGQPLRIRQEQGGIVIYSIGNDDKDDGGSDESIGLMQPDIAIRVQLAD